MKILKKIQFSKNQNRMKFVGGVEDARKLFKEHKSKRKNTIMFLNVCDFSGEKFCFGGKFHKIVDGNHKKHQKLSHGKIQIKHQIKNKIGNRHQKKS